MSSKLRWLGGFTLIGALATNSAWAGNSSPALVLEWSVNGGPVNLILPQGLPVGNSFIYEGVATDNATGLELEYDLAGNPLSTIVGNVNIFNALTAPIAVNVSVRLPLVPDLPEGTLLAGTCTIGLSTGPDGGQIGSLPPALFQTLVDAAPAGFNTTLFWDEFFMGSSGQGNASTHSDYGVPQPVPGPPLWSSLGYALHFTLTPADLGSITAQVTTSGKTAFCSEDINDSGNVGSEDLLELSLDWGPCANCAADLDSNNAVDTKDLLILLSAWGPCPG